MLDAFIAALTTANDTETLRFVAENAARLIEARDAPVSAEHVDEVREVVRKLAKAPLAAEQIEAAAPNAAKPSETLAEQIIEGAEQIEARATKPNAQLSEMLDFLRRANELVCVCRFSHADCLVVIFGAGRNWRALLGGWGSKAPRASPMNV